MLDVDALQGNIVELVALASGMPEGQIQLMLGGELPEIPGPYCSVRMNTDRTVGAPSPKYRASETEHVLDQLIHVATEVEFSINFFRSGAMQYANNMKSAPYRWQVQRHLYQKRLGWLRFGPIHNLTSFFSGWYEERAQANLAILIDGVDAQQVNQALHVDVIISE